MYSLKFNLAKNKDNIKSITLETNPGDWKEHRSNLSAFKSSINEYLTELVELEKITDIEIEINESESSEDEKGSKRILIPRRRFEKNKIQKI